MGFLTPAFLAGLAALAVPILVHLTNRPRRETVVFPSLMFLEKIPYRSVQRQTLRHWALFALRCTAFVILAPGRTGSQELVRELQDHCRRVSAPYKYPREIEFVDDLPKTRSGKIRRVELRQRDASEI